jgi:hypothetical protein
MKKVKAIKMATGGLMSMPPYIAKQDKTSDGITPYDVNTPMSARQGLPSRALDKSRTRFSRGDVADKDNTKINPEAKKNIDNYLASSNMATKRKRAVEKAVEDAVIKMDVMEGKIASEEEIKDIIKFYENKIRGRAEGGLMQRMKFDEGGEAFPDLSGDGEITQEDILIGKGVIKKAKGGIMQRMKFSDGDSVKDKIEARKFKQLEIMKEEGLELTPKQEQELEAYKAKDRKVEMAIGGVVGNESISKYNQRPDYQAYAEGDIVEDEMSDEDMPPMKELEVEEESLLQPRGMDDEMPMDDEEDITDEDLESMDAIIDTSALSEEEEQLLDEAVDMHPELEAIIPKLVATEFTDDGEVEGPGTGTSDSIPALLSDGEFVFTAKAVKNIGVDKLRKMMKQAEADYDAGIQSQEEEMV